MDLNNPEPAATSADATGLGIMACSVVLEADAVAGSCNDIALGPVLALAVDSGKFVADGIAGCCDDIAVGPVLALAAGSGPSGPSADGCCAGTCSGQLVACDRSSLRTNGLGTMVYTGGQNGDARGDARLACHCKPTSKIVSTQRTRAHRLRDDHQAMSSACQSNTSHHCRSLL